MTRCWIAIAALAATVCLFAGCGGSSSNQPVVAPAPKQTGTISASLKRARIVQDVLTLNRETAAGGAAVNSVYALLNTAAQKKSATEGAAMIRSHLPRIVAMFDNVYPHERAVLIHQHMQTRAGESLRRFHLYLMAAWNNELSVFAADVKRSKYVWPTVERFGTQNNAMLNKANARLSAFMRSLPPSQKKVLLAAVTQEYGRG
jgi:hypothetical protein